MEAKGTLIKGMQGGSLLILQKKDEAAHNPRPAKRRLLLLQLSRHTEEASRWAAKDRYLPKPFRDQTVPKQGSTKASSHWAVVGKVKGNARGLESVPGPP